MITMLLVDDQPVVRRCLRMRLALEPDLLIVGEAADGAAALDLARRLLPDVVLMDMLMPRMDGIAATSALRVAVPSSAVIMLSLHDDAASQARAQTAGARAFVVKHDGVERLIAAVRQAASSS